jgi:hypothetical protein
MSGHEVRVNKAFAHCRWCGSTKTARSRLRWYDRWRTMLSSARPHRCFDCGRRFWDTPAADDAEST